jgi:cell wall-associated NlpC family hydrolase
MREYRHIPASNKFPGSGIKFENVIFALLYTNKIQLSLQKIIYIWPVLLLAVACSPSRNSQTAGKPTVTRTSPASPQFLENINLTSADDGPGAGNTANTGLLIGPGHSSVTGAALNIESGTDLQFKYAVLLDENVESMNNLPLLQFIDEWFGTKYKYGGVNKAGIDCSAFTSALKRTVYGKTIPRTSREQFDQSQKIPSENLQAGDLVFFNTRGGVSHVGIYVANNKFVHASTSYGVTLSDLNDDYYKRRFIGAGRL